LIDQTLRGDFKHFGNSLTIVQNHHVDKAYEIYLALYQGLSGAEEASNIYKQFSRDFLT
jgi:type I restriction enzyme R subunit